MKNLQSKIRVDGKTDAMLLNRYLCLTKQVKYDDSDQENKKIAWKRTLYEIQWQNIKADMKGLALDPMRVAPRVGLSLAAFCFILFGKHEQAMTMAFAGSIGYDNKAQSSHSGEPTTINCTVTVGGGSEMIALCGANGLSGGLTATFNGNAVTQIASEQGALKCWYQLAPPSGSRQLVVSGGNIKTCAVITLTGVDQTTPIGNTAVNNGGASPKAIALTTTVDGAMRLDWLGANRDDSTVPTGTMDAGTLRNNPNTSQNQFRIDLFSYTNPIATAGATTQTWTTSAFNRYYITYEVKPSVGGGGDNL